jgi:hypothetical protein
MRAAHRLLKRQQERQRKLEKQGIEYDFGAAGYVRESPSLFYLNNSAFFRNFRKQSKLSTDFRCRLYPSVHSNPTQRWAIRLKFVTCSILVQKDAQILDSAILQINHRLLVQSALVSLQVKLAS